VERGDADRWITAPRGGGGVQVWPTRPPPGVTVTDTSRTPPHASTSSVRAPAVERTDPPATATS